MKSPWIMTAAIGLGVASSFWENQTGPSSAPFAPSAAYVPVASPAALNAAARSNLKLARHWLGEKDFLSAAAAVHGLATLVQLYGLQSSEPDWRKRIAALQQACTRLADAVRRRSLATCGIASAECDRLLDDLAKRPPAPTKPDPNIKPFGGNQVWMMLMEGAYGDAKRAETARELEQLSQVIAEEVGMVGRLRPDAKWRTSADAVRQVALQVARLAGANDLPAARKALKEVYRRCEVCHQRDKR